MNSYTFVVKSGKNKNQIIDTVYRNTRKEAFEYMKQSLTDAGVYREAAGYVFVRNFVIKTQKNV